MSPLRRFVLIASCLIAAATGVLLLEAATVTRLTAEGDAAAERAAERSLDAVQLRFRALERELLDRAEQLAAKPGVRSALEDPTLRHEAITTFDRLRLPEGYAAELYTALPELIAWQGPGVPLDPAVRRLDFLAGVQSAIVNDGLRRQALVVWAPIMAEGRVLGAVRLVRLVRQAVPVQNQYMQDWDLVERWTRGMLPAVSAHPDPADGDLVRTRALESIDGFTLVHLTAEVPRIDALVAHRRARFGDAFAFFITLLAGWLFFGLGSLAIARIARAVSGDARPAGAILIGGVLLAAWIGMRYVLLTLGVPARFAVGTPPPAAFDPAFVGSGFGGGIAGSALELVITAIFALVAGAVAAYVGWRIAFERRAGRSPTTSTRAPRLVGILSGLIAAGAAVAVLMGAGRLVARATEDATLGYLDRAGPIPEALVLLVFGAFLLIFLSALLWLVALVAGFGLHRRGFVLSTAVGVVAASLAAYVYGGLAGALPPLVLVGSLGVGAAAGTWHARRPERWIAAFSLRGGLLAAFVITGLTYPVVLGALQVKEEARLRDAVEDFADGEDPRVAFALESVLIDARDSEVVRAAFAETIAGRPLPPGLADSLAADLVTGSLLAALADYRVGLTLHAPDGDPLGRYLEEAPVQLAGRVAPAPMPPDPVVFSRMRRLYEEEALFAGFAVERRPAGSRGGKFRYAGFGPVRATDDERLLGWITARAEPRPARYVAETPFPRVLVPAGLYRLADEQWIFAEFGDGVLQRSRGASFGRFRLPSDVAELPVGASAWRNERLEGQPVQVYYRRVSDERVVAARIPATTLFDHLYFMLRILVAGLLLAALAYLLGSGVRRASDRIPQRMRLRDRVLNRFLLVGLVAVVATGVIGREVIVTQNRDAVEERLKRQLARVEATLFEEVGNDLEGPVPPELILDRARPDLVGPRLGLDVNLYRGAELVASSRSQLVRQRLIEQRLPIEVVQRLFVDGERYAFATERIGRFRYTTGYEAIPDARGFPAVVIAVPTLPEQFAIEADQARMVAYLFGVLLLLLLLIFGVATVLASRLTQPFRRLREGLRAVGAGEAPAEPIPVERRDEVGEVIETFNAVWDQLEESRRRLAAQERELAWREMARQVAHEIKNPLTPMRLSVQHLRRAFERAQDDGGPDGRFGELFDRISNTLIEQIDALNRIAGEFSNFGRMPERDLQTFDLNEVIRQAAALVGEESQAEVILDLASEQLPVRADREELRRVYINLLKNAQQAIPEGEHGLITISSEVKKGSDGPAGAVRWAQTTVRDSGTGIAKDIQPRIFKPNFSTKTSGMGLGLAIARKTIEDFGGDITFETEPGIGTTFIVRLALAAARLPARA